MTVRAQLRAHVFPESAGLYEGSLLTPPREDKIKVPGVVLIWKNTGQTPAANVVSWGQIAVIPVTQEHTLLTPPLRNVFSNHLGAGIGGNKNLWFDRPLTDAEIEEIAAGTIGIYLYGRIEYRDVFKRNRWTNFRLIYTGGAFPPVIAGAGFSLCEAGNNAGYWSPFYRYLSRLLFQPVPQTGANS